MAKSKYAPALFEVIDRQCNTGNKLGVPKWWKGLGRAAASETPGESDQPAGTIATAPAGIDEALTPAACEPEDPGATAQTAPPISRQSAAEDQVCPGMFQVEGGRMWISLNTSQAAIVGSILVAALVATFALGRMSRSSNSSAEQNDSDVARILAEAPNSSVLKAAPDKASPAASKRTRTANPVAGNEASVNAASAGQEDLKIGQCYVWLDTYARGDRASAEHVQKWLATTHNIPTIIKPTANSYRLFSKAGFDWSNPDEQEKCKQLSERIKSLGDECKRELNKANLRVYAFASPQIREITPK